MVVCQGRFVMKNGSEIMDKIDELYFNHKGMTDEQFGEYLKLMIKLLNSENIYEFKSEFSMIKHYIWEIEYNTKEIKRLEDKIKELEKHIKNGTKMENTIFDTPEHYKDTIKFIKDEEIAYHKQELSHPLNIMSLSQWKTAYQLLLKYMLENKKSNALSKCFTGLEHEDQIKVAKYFVEQKDTESLLFLAQQNTIGYGNAAEQKDIIKGLQNLICEKKDKMEYYRFLTYYADYYSNSKNKTDEFKPVLKEMANQLFEMIKKDKDLALCEDIILGRIDKDYQKNNDNNVGKLLNRRELLKFYCQNATEKQINHLFDEIDNYRKESEKEPVYYNNDYEYLC